MVWNPNVELVLDKKGEFANLGNRGEMSLLEFRENESGAQSAFFFFPAGIRVTESKERSQRNTEGGITRGSDSAGRAKRLARSGTINKDAPQNRKTHQEISSRTEEPDIKERRNKRQTPPRREQ